MSILLAGALTGTATLAHAEDPLPPPGPCGAQAEAARALVTSAYARLVEFTTLEDYDLDFKLGGFLVQDRAAFLAEPWDSRFGARPIQRLRVERGEISDEGTLLGAYYWPLLDELAPPLPDFGSAPLVQVLGSEVDQFSAGAGCFLTFEVEVSESRVVQNYRAFASWPVTEPPTAANIGFWDPVVRGIDLALHETAPVGRSDDLMTERSRRQIERYGHPLAWPSADLGDVPGDTPDTTCGPQDKYYRPPTIAFGPDRAEHLFLLGYHQSSARFEMHCACDSRCTSYCTPSIVESRCEDVGAAVTVFGTPKEHREKHREAGFGSFEAEATMPGQGAECSVGFGCFIESCLVSCIGPGPNLISSGTARTPVTFSASATVLWEGSPSHQGGCDHCRAPLPLLRRSGGRHGIFYPDPDPGAGTSGGVPAGFAAPTQVMRCYPRWQPDPPTRVEYCVIEFI